MFQEKRIEKYNWEQIHPKYITIIWGLLMHELVPVIVSVTYDFGLSDEYRQIWSFWRFSIEKRLKRAPKNIFLKSFYRKALTKNSKKCFLILTWWIFRHQVSLKSKKFARLITSTFHSWVVDWVCYGCNMFYVWELCCISIKKCWRWCYSRGCHQPSFMEVDAVPTQVLYYYIYPDNIFQYLDR